MTAYSRYAQIPIIRLLINAVAIRSHGLFSVSSQCYKQVLPEAIRL